MSLTEIRPEGWPRPSGYANGLVAPAGSRTLYIAGMVGWGKDERMVSEELVAQFAQALRNIRDIVEAAGGKVEHVARMTFYVVSKTAYHDARPAIASQWKEVFGRHYPAATLVEVSGLLEEGALVEIEATAALPPE